MAGSFSPWLFPPGKLEVPCSHFGHLVTILLLVTQLSASCYYGYHDCLSSRAPLPQAKLRWTNPSTCSLRTLLMVSGLLIGFLRCWKLLPGISNLQDTSDPWLFSTPITTSPSILSGSLIHYSLEINPPGPVTDALLGFHSTWTDAPKDKLMKRKNQSQEN